MSFLSAVLSLYTYRGYSTECFRAFHEGEDATFPFHIGDINGTDTEVVLEALREIHPEISLDENDNIELYFRWRPGNGLVCIILATLLKAIDIIAVFLRPTPNIAHTRSMQEEYEVLYGPDADANEGTATVTNTDDIDGDVEVITTGNTDGNTL